MKTVLFIAYIGFDSPYETLYSRLS